MYEVQRRRGVRSSGSTTGPVSSWHDLRCGELNMHTVRSRFRMWKPRIDTGTVSQRHLLTGARDELHSVPTRISLFGSRRGTRALPCWEFCNSGAASVYEVSPRVRMP